MKRLSFWGKTEGNNSSLFYSKGGKLKDVESITPIRTSFDSSKSVYLGIRLIHNKNYLVYQIGEVELNKWKPLLEVNSVNKASKALRQLRIMYLDGVFIQCHEIKNTFRYLYGFKRKK